MKDPAEVIRDLLVAASVGTFNASTGWSITIGEPSDSPDTNILISASGGGSPYPHLLINFPSVQVFVRGKKSGYQDAQAKAREIVKVLLGRAGYTDAVSGDVYQSFTQTGDVAYLGQDENTRPMFTANFSLIVLPAAESGGHRTAIT